MAQRAALVSALFAAASRAQQACTTTTETKPTLSWSQCTASGCTNTSGSVTIDANWRWAHDTSGSTNCYSKYHSSPVTGSRLSYFGMFQD